MKKKLIKMIYCPECKGRFNKDVLNAEEKLGEIYQGMLVCSECGSQFPIIRYIPRLVKGYNYSDSWGLLWRNTGHILRDSHTGTKFYFDTIHGKYSEEGDVKDGYSVFGFNWPKKLKGENILEIGPGTGVCTEHLVETGAQLTCVDMSDAIDTFPESLLTKPNINVVQGDINLGIIEQNYFDRIWLFQVLQHTPEPGETLKQIRPFLKKGGELAFTSYGGADFNPWYYRFTKRIPDKLAWKLISFFVPLLLPIKYIILKMNIPVVSRVLGKFMDPIDPRNMYYNTLTGKLDQWAPGILWNRNRDKKELVYQAIINTFDRITPEYTNTGTHEMIEEWCKEAGYSKATTWGKSGVRAKAIR